MTSNALFRDPQLETVLMLEGLMPNATRLAFEHLERFTHRSVRDLAAAYWSNRQDADQRAQARVSAASHEADVLAYYRQTPQYLYELSYVEGSVKRQGWLRVLVQACRRYGLRHVLDVGGGIGSVSLYLQARGIRCDYLDVPGQTFDCARWRFAQRGLDVAAYDATSSWPPGPYDGIIAWDVLEHLKNLKEKLQWLAGRLRPGGRLIHWSTFTECEGVHLPENHRYGDIRQFDALLQECGFRYQGQLKPNQPSRVLRTLGWKAATCGIRVSRRLKFGGCFLLHERVGS